MKEHISARPKLDDLGALAPVILAKRHKSSDFGRKIKGAGVQDRTPI